MYTYRVIIELKIYYKNKIYLMHFEILAQSGRLSIHFFSLPARPYSDLSYSLITTSPLTLSPHAPLTLCVPVTTSLTIRGR